MLSNLNWIIELSLCLFTIYLVSQYYTVAKHINVMNKYTVCVYSVIYQMHTFISFVSIIRASYTRLKTQKV